MSDQKISAPSYSICWITFIKADLFWLSHRLSLAFLSRRKCTTSTCPLAQAIWSAVLQEWKQCFQCINANNITISLSFNSQYWFVFTDYGECWQNPLSNIRYGNKRPVWGLHSAHLFSLSSWLISCFSASSFNFPTSPTAAALCTFPRSLSFSSYPPERTLPLSGVPEERFFFFVRLKNFFMVHDAAVLRYVGTICPNHLFQSDSRRLALPYKIGGTSLIMKLERLWHSYQAHSYQAIKVTTVLTFPLYIWHV